MNYGLKYAKLYLTLIFVVAIVLVIGTFIDIDLNTLSLEVFVSYIITSSLSLFGLWGVLSIADFEKELIETNEK